VLSNLCAVHVAPRDPPRPADQRRPHPPGPTVRGQPRPPSAEADRRGWPGLPVLRRNDRRVFMSFTSSSSREPAGGGSPTARPRTLWLPSPRGRHRGCSCGGRPIRRGTSPGAARASPCAGRARGVRCDTGEDPGASQALCAHLCRPRLEPAITAMSETHRRTRDEPVRVRRTAAGGRRLNPHSPRARARSRQVTAPASNPHCERCGGDPAAPQPTSRHHPRRCGCPKLGSGR
jgi:hypothetical protein